MKKFVKVIGNVTKDVDLERVASFLKQDAEAMTGRTEGEDTKTVVIEISVKEMPNG